MEVRDLYGKGLDYPFIIEAGQIRTTEYEAKINAALLMLFDTDVGERFMNPAYGCRLKRLLFEQDSETFEIMARQYIESAIEIWEPRVQRIVDIKFDYENKETRRTPVGGDESRIWPGFHSSMGQGAQVVNIIVEYELIGSQIVSNFVYPFISM